MLRKIGALFFHIIPNFQKWACNTKSSWKTLLVLAGVGLVIYRGFALRNDNLFWLFNVDQAPPTIFLVHWLTIVFWFNISNILSFHGRQCISASSFRSARTHGSWVYELLHQHTPFTFLTFFLWSRSVAEQSCHNMAWSVWVWSQVRRDMQIGMNPIYLSIYQRPFWNPFFAQEKTVTEIEFQISVQTWSFRTPNSQCQCWCFCWS